VSKKLSPAQREVLVRGQRIRTLRGAHANLSRLVLDKAFTDDQRIQLKTAIKWIENVMGTI